MSKTFIGDVCGHCPGKGADGKAAYPRMGSAFKDGDRISIKIDTIPLPSTGWSGWVNIFPRTAGKPPVVAEDDVPF